METLPNPGMVPTSQEAGGMVHTNELAMTAPGSPPGFDGGALIYPTSADVGAPAADKANTPQIPVDNTREPVRYNPDAGVETR